MAETASIACTAARRPGPRRMRLAALAVTALLLASGTTFAAEPYKIHVGDVLHISVFGEQGLSGDFPVAPDGRIGYPIVGNVAVAGLTTPDVSVMLAKSLKKHMPGLSVATDIRQYSPVFVLGEVKTPGKYEYRPGMIALELLALAGGVSKPEALADSAQVQIVAAKQDYADLALQLIADEAKRARFQAEFNNADFVAPAVDDADPSLRQIRQQAIDGQHALFDLRKNALKADDQALAGQEDSYRDEIRVISERIKLYGNEMALAEQDVASSQKLADKGLMAKSNLRETERVLSSLHRDELEAESYLARAKQNLQAIQQQRLTLVNTRRSEAAASLQDVNIEIARLRQNQKAILMRITEIAAASDDSQAKQLYRKLEMTVLRAKDGQEQEIEANDRLELVPGDILQVRFIYPKTLAQNEQVN